MGRGGWIRTPHAVLVKGRSQSGARMLGQCVYNGWRMGFCVRKSGSSERVAYGPKPRENALSRVLSAPHSPDDCLTMDDGAVGGNPLNGAFPGVQATLPPASPTPHPLSSYSPRNKTPWQALSERLRGILYCGSHSQFGGGAVLAGGSSRNLFRDHAGQLLPECRTGLPSNPGTLCLPAVLPGFRTGYLPRQPTFHTGHAERESGRVCGGLCDLLTGAGGRQSPPCCSRRSKSNSPRGECHDPSLGGLAFFA